MAQYFNSVFILINFILINYFVCLSFCDNQSYEVIFYNSSALEIIENFDSNSSIYNRHQLSSRNINNTRLKNSEYSGQRRKCQSYRECHERENCCQYDVHNEEKVCIDAYRCKGPLGKECNSSSPCQTELFLECPSSYRVVYGQKTCQCKNDRTFDFILAKCELKTDYSSSMQIYKITMIFASCCLALILIIFLVCILRKSYCVPRRQMMPLDNATIPDIFTLFPHVGNYDGGPLADGTLPPFEKPPTYDETLTLIRNEIGIPPPAYRSGNSPNSTNPSTPEMSTRVLITNPTLFTVNTESIRINSGINSSSDESLAGPSGSGTSRQGIDNPAFC